MRRIVLSALFAVTAMATMASTTLALSTETPVASFESQEIVSTIEGVPSNALPLSGECRIFFDNVPAHKQPASMECEHALWIAQSWGGRVLAAKGQQHGVVATFAGRNDFTGVPADAIPPRGYCRAWLDGVSADQQPQYSDCIEARRTARENNGRVLFMPV